MEVDEAVRESIRFVPVDHLDTVIRHALVCQPEEWDTGVECEDSKRFGYRRRKPFRGNDSHNGDTIARLGSVIKRYKRGKYP